MSKKPSKKEIVRQILSKSKVFMLEHKLQEFIDKFPLYFENKYIQNAQKYHKEVKIHIKNIKDRNNRVINDDSEEVFLNKILKIDKFKENMLNYYKWDDSLIKDIDKKFLDYSINCDKFSYSNYNNYVKDWTDPSNRINRHIDINGKMTESKGISLQCNADSCLADYRKVANDLQEELYQVRSRIVSQFLKEINDKVSTELLNYMRLEIDKIYEIIGCDEKNRPVNKFVFRMKNFKNIIPESNYSPYIETRERTKKVGVIFKKNVEYIEERITSSEIQKFCDRSKIYLNKLIEEVKYEVIDILTNQIMYSINEYITQELENIYNILETKKEELYCEIEKNKKYKNFLEKYNLKLDEVFEFKEDYLIETQEENENHKTNRKYMEFINDIFGNKSVNLDDKVQDDTIRKLTKMIGKELSKKELLIGIENGNSDINNIMGKICYSKNDYLNAVKYFNVSSEKGSDEAKLNLGLMYLKGEGVNKSEKCGIDFIEKSAKNGFARAQNELGILYNFGEVSIIGQSYKQAFEWFQHAAKSGYIEAKRNLAGLYYNGTGTEKDYFKAFKWFKEAAEQGNVYSQSMLVNLYYYGKGVEKNIEEAIKWAECAANSGDIDSQFALGYIYSHEENENRDYSKAIKWYTVVAEIGHDMAQNNLGELYRFGYGTEKDYGKALELYKLAIKKNNLYAYANIGEMYEMGQGVEKNLSEAKEWYKLAYEYGFQEAKEKINNLN